MFFVSLVCSVAVMKYGSAIIVAVLNASIFLGWERRCCTAIRGACVGQHLIDHSRQEPSIIMLLLFCFFYTNNNNNNNSNNNDN